MLIRDSDSSNYKNSSYIAQIIYRIPESYYEKRVFFILLFEVNPYKNEPGPLDKMRWIEPYLFLCIHYTYIIYNKPSTLTK